MTEEKTCYNCGNKNCIVYYSTAKKDCKRHYETYEYTNFECVNHDKWEELKVEEIRTDNTKTLKNALERITELEKENEELKEQVEISYEVYNDNLDYSHHIEEQLTKAKEIISEYIRLANLEKEDTIAIWQLYHKAEQFLKEVGECL